MTNDQMAALFAGIAGEKSVGEIAGAMPILREHGGNAEFLTELYQPLQRSLHLEENGP